MYGRLVADRTLLVRTRHQFSPHATTLRFPSVTHPRTHLCYPPAYAPAVRPAAALTTRTTRTLHPCPPAPAPRENSMNVAFYRIYWVERHNH